MNGKLFNLFYGSTFKGVTKDTFKIYGLSGFAFRVLGSADLALLTELISRQPAKDLVFFKPHEFDDKSLLDVYRNPAFIMMGSFEGEKMVGYFFLRCFWNKKCFVGRLVDREYQGRGIGKMMNEIMYNIAWRSGFRCLSTISRNNKAVMSAHAKNDSMVILKELDNDYMLVEFVKKGDKVQGLKGSMANTDMN